MSTKTEWRLVPVEPTDEMYADCDNQRLAQLYWRKLINKAPTPQASEPDWYHAECDDPDYSGFFRDRADAESQISDHGGTISELYDHAKPCERCAELEASLETERIRIAACGVVAMANTPKSAAKARNMLPEYRSASCDDVARVVDSEMSLRGKLASLEAENARLAEELQITEASEKHWSDAYRKWVETDISARNLIEQSEQLSKQQATIAQQAEQLAQKDKLAMQLKDLWEAARKHLAKLELDNVLLRRVADEDQAEINQLREQLAAAQKVIELCVVGLRQWHVPANRYAALDAIAAQKEGKCMSNKPIFCGRCGKTNVPTIHTCTPTHWARETEQALSNLRHLVGFLEERIIELESKQK